MIATGVAGEFGPILAISLLLTGAAGPGTNAALLLAFAIVAVGARRCSPCAPARRRSCATIERTMHSSGQFAIRLAILILMASSTSPASSGSTSCSAPSRPASSSGW